MNTLNKIHKVAAELFYKQGILATGVDQLSKKSGLSKRTLYKHCSSKAALVLQFLGNRDKTWNLWFRMSVEEKYNPGIDRLLGLFDILAKWFKEPGFRGCAFLNTAAEITDRRTKQYQLCQKHKEDMDLIIQLWLNEAMLNNVEKLSFQVGLLIDGAIIRAQLFDDSSAAASAKEICKKLLQS